MNDKKHIQSKKIMVIWGSIVFSLILAQSVLSQATNPLVVRELYAPAHFGNSYEVMGELEMRASLTEAVYWGFNRYGDWFDMDNCTDPFADTRHYKLGHALWDKKKANFRTAQSLGLDCDLIITPNHVYLDQCLPGLLAKKEGRIFGQLICPSIPAARELILQNYTNLFQDLKQSGVQLKSISLCPYDYGGCACTSCNPWIVTFAKLSHEIYTIAEKYHPGIEAHMIGWWWKEKEHQLFAGWVNEFAPGWIKSIYMHIPYRETDVSMVILPNNCERRAFVHIGYAQVSKDDPIDKYGHLGPVIAVERLEETVENLIAQKTTGYMAYSEGVYEDVNRALLSGISSGKYPNADKVLCEYVQCYFNADDSEIHEWVEWLKKWDAPFDVDPYLASVNFEKIVDKNENNWRLEQWAYKTELFKLHQQTGNDGEWTAERLAVVDQFWAVQEEMFRKLWGLGPLRQILARKSTPLPWFKSWMAYEDQIMKVINTSFTSVFISDLRFEELKKAVKEEKEPTYTAYLEMRKVADQNLGRNPTASKEWYVPGYYDDAEGHRKAKNGLRDDANAAYAQALCYRITGDLKYAQSAIQLINAWVSTVKIMSRKDDSTLSFSYHFPALIFAADLLRGEKVWPDNEQILFSDFLRNKALPMSTIDRENNWGNWGLVLSAACAVYLKDEFLFETCIERWKYFIENQIAPDGHLPHEVKRRGGKSGIWYTHFCLMPQTIAAEILRLNGQDLYNFVSPGGRRLEQAFDKIADWTRRPADFPYWEGDPAQLGGRHYISYFELLNPKWPNKDAIELLRKSRPLTATHSAPFLTFTHGKSLKEAEK